MLLSVCDKSQTNFPIGCSLVKFISLSSVSLHTTAAILMASTFPITLHSSLPNGKLAHSRV